MAEAAVEQTLHKFFCHQCSVEINPNLPEYTCPRCQSGFIEEMTEEFDDGQNSVENEADPAVQFAQLMRRTFLEGLDALSNQQEGENDSNRLEEEQSSAQNGSDTQPTHHHHHFHLPPRTRIPLHRLHRDQHLHQHQAPPGIEMIVQQLLTGLVGGAAYDQHGHGIPFLQPVFNLYGNPGDYAWGPQGLDSVITQLLNQLDGTGPPPAAKDQIDAIPTIIVTKEHVEGGMQCPVCMEDFAVEEKVMRLPCKHCYHRDCIVPWLELHGTCPVCRKTLSGEDTSCRAMEIPENLAQSASTSASSSATTSSSSSSSQDRFLPDYDMMEDYDID